MKFRYSSFQHHRKHGNLYESLLYLKMPLELLYTYTVFSRNWVDGSVEFFDTADVRTSGIWSFRFWNEKKVHDAGTNSVPEEGDEVQHFLVRYRMR